MLIGRFGSVLASFDDAFAAVDRRLACPGVWAAACILLVALQLTLVFTHEPWRDEWQALQIAVQSPTLADLFDNLRYEGHPPLWYFTLRLLSAIVGPQAALATAMALIALAGQALILAGSPFSRAERLMLAASEFLLFEYFTISRSLSLGVLLILAALALWRHRTVWIPIALLPLCDFQFGVISIAFALLQWRDKRLWRPGVAFWLMLGLFAAWSVRPAAGMVPPDFPRGFAIESGAFLDRLGSVLFPLQWDQGIRWNSTLPGVLAPICGTAFLVFAWVQTRGDWPQRLVLFGFILTSWLFSTLVYGLSIRHVLLIAVLYVALQWLAAPRARTWGWRVWLLGGAICGLTTAAAALSVPFDAAGQVAREIQRLGLTRKHWMSFPAEHGQGVAALTGIGFERPERPCWQQFVRWNEPLRIDEPDQLEAVLPDAAARNGRFYLLSNQRLAPFAVSSREIAVFPPGLNNEGYALYEIDPDLPPRRPATPPCVREQRPLPTAR